MSDVRFKVGDKVFIDKEDADGFLVPHNVNGYIITNFMSTKEIVMLSFSDSGRGGFVVPVCILNKEDPTLPKKTPHKHAEVIKAWADGASLEARFAGSDLWWVPCENPQFHEAFEYRVKKEEPKKITKNIKVLMDDEVVVSEFDIGLGEEVTITFLGGK